MKKFFSFIILSSIVIVSPVTVLALEESKEQKEQAEKIRFLKLSEKERAVQKTKSINNRIEQNLLELKNLQVNMETKNISITKSSIIDIDLHPMHFTKIYFPVGTKIFEQKSTVKLETFDMFQNRLEIRPMNELVQTSISVSFLYEDNLYDITIIGNRYDVGSNRNSFDNMFSPKIALTIDKPLTPTKVMREYYAQYGVHPAKKLTFFEVNNKIYKIYKDDFTYRRPNNEPNLLVVEHNTNNELKYRITTGEYYGR